MKKPIPQPKLNALHKSALFFSCVILSLLAQIPNIRAASLFWDNNGTGAATSGTWDTVSLNWTTSSTLTTPTVAFTNGDFAEFSAGGANSALTITVTNEVDCAGINNLISTNLTFSGTGPIGITTGLQGFLCGASGADSLTFNVPLTGPGGLEQEGGGTLFLYATNTYSGGTELTGGQLLFYNNYGSFGTGPITYAGTQSILNGAPGVVTLSNAWVFNNAGGVANFASGNTICAGPVTLMTTPQIKNNSGINPLTFSGPISGAFGMAFQNDNATNGTGLGFIILSGANSYSGPTEIGQGAVGGATTLSVTSINSVSSPPQQATSSLGKPSSATNGVITFGNSTSGSGTYNNQLTYTGAGETSDRGLSFVGTTGGVFVEMDGTGPLVLTGPIFITQNGARTLHLQGNSTAANTIGGAIPNSGSGATSLTKAQAGTWVLTGTNTFTGNTTISAGELMIGGAGRLNSGSYAGTIANSGSFVYNSSQPQTLSGVISGAGTLTNSGTGTLTLSGANTYTGVTTLGAGILNADKAETVGTSGPLGKSVASNPGSIVLNGGTLQYSSANNADYSGRFNTTANIPYNIDVNGVSVTYANAPLSSSGGTLTLNSTAAGGTLTLNAAETYTGPTTINSGTLVIGTSGSLDGGTYAANIIDNGGFTYSGPSAQTLSGTFTGTGALTENGAGSLTLSSATVLYSGATTIGAGSTLYITAAEPTNDTSSLNIGVGGTLDISGISSTAYTMTNSTSLTAAGSSTAAATINGASGETILLGSQPMSLTISPTTFTGETTQPALAILQASLSLGGGNIITVNNASGTPLGAGNYVLISVGGGTTTGTPSQYVTVTGSGLAGDLYATVQVVGGNVVLAVTQPANLGPTWNGNDYANHQTWSDGANWVSTTAPDATGDEVHFANTSSQTPVMDSSYSVVSLTFDSGAASDILSNSGGSVLTVGGGVTNNSVNAQTLAMPVQLVDLGGPVAPSQWSTAGGNITVSGVVADNNIGLTVSGGNTLALSGVNTYTGPTVINGATLSANTVSDAACSIGTGALTIEGGGTLAFTGAAGATTRTIAVSGATTDTINVPSGDTLSLNGQVHSVSDTAAQMLTLTGGGTLNLGGTVDNSGLTMAINSGTVVITKTSASTAHGLGGGSDIIGTGSAGNTALLRLAGSGGFDLYSGVILTLQNPDGFLDFGGQNDTFSTLTNNNPTAGAIINSSTNTSTISAATVLNVNTTIGGGSSLGPITLSGVISGAHSLTQAGPGLLTLNGANTFSGGLNINAGTAVTLGNLTAAGSGPTTITINGNGVLNLSATGLGYTNTITGGSTSVINIGSGTANTYISGSLTGFSGTINCNAGQDIINQANNVANPIGASATWNILNGATLDLATPYVTDAASVIVNGTGNNAYGCLRLDACNQTGSVLLNGTNVTIGNGNAGLSTISGVISDNGHGYGFTFVSGGANGGLALTAANTYNGPTVVNTSSLFLSGSGSIANSSSISLANGTTFNVFGVTTGGGTYYLGGTQTLATLGGSASINGYLDVTAGSPLSFKYSTTNAPLTVTNGTLYLDNNAVTVNNAGHALGVGSYTMIQSASSGSIGSIVGTPNPVVTVTGGGVAPGTWSTLVVSGGNVNLVVSPMPMINSVAAAGGSMIFSGSNGVANGTFVVLTSTNVTTPLDQWTPLSTNTFDANGGFSVTNNIGPSPSRFFQIEIQN